MFALVYGRFLTISTIIAPTIAITIMMAIAEVKMYVSVIGVAGVGVGDAVGWASITLKLFSADDGQ